MRVTIHHGDTENTEVRKEHIKEKSFLSQMRARKVFFSFAFILTLAFLCALCDSVVNSYKMHFEAGTHFIHIILQRYPKPKAEPGMAQKDVFRLVSQVIQESNITCVLIGGFAIGFYGVMRQTVDVDFLVTEEDFLKIDDALTQLGYKKSYSQELFTRFSNPQTGEMDLDFIYVDRGTIEKIAASGKTVEIGGQTFTIPSLNHLIALKLHSIKQNPHLREPKDLPDIIQLMRANNIPADSPDIKALCLKFGTKELYEKIKNEL